MKKSFRSLMAVVTALTLAYGCKVDDRYDFNNVDTEVSMFKGLKFPIGSLRPYTLDEILGLKESEYFYALENGDYHIRVPFDPFYFEVPVPLSSEYLPESGTTFEFTGLPEFLNDEDNSARIELAGIEVGIAVGNSIPETAVLGTSVVLSRSGATTHEYRIDNLEIAPGTTNFLFSEAGSGPRNDVVYTALPQLDKFFSPVPDKLIINDFYINIPSTVPADDYDVSCQVSVDSPVAFTADSHCDLTIPVENASVELDQIGLKKAVLTMNVYNSIPLEFSLSAVAMDGKGGYVEGISAQTDVPVAAGTTDSPVLTPLTVTLTTDGDLRFHGIELHLHAASNASVAGVHLNKNQCLELKDLVITLPDGINVTL